MSLMCYLGLYIISIYIPSVLLKLPVYDLDVLLMIVHYIYIFISKEILLSGSWNLTTPPHRSPGGGSVFWGTSSDGILVRRAPGTSTSGVFRAASGSQTFFWVYATPEGSMR
jgi:hypothetical protein